MLWSFVLSCCSQYCASVCQSATEELEIQGRMPAYLHVFLCVRVCAHHVQVNRNSALAVSEVGEDTPAAKAGLVPVRVCLAASG